tara:strand:- start:20285 stop:20941 length:657 start_codon:yes stop_codon:yes gene_type:complete
MPERPYNSLESSQLNDGQVVASPTCLLTSTVHEGGVNVGKIENAHEVFYYFISASRASLPGYHGLHESTAKIRFTALNIALHNNSYTEPFMKAVYSGASIGDITVTSIQHAGEESLPSFTMTYKNCRPVSGKVSRLNVGGRLGENVMSRGHYEDRVDMVNRPVDADDPYNRSAEVTACCLKILFDQVAIVYHALTESGEVDGQIAGGFNLVKNTTELE